MEKLFVQRRPKVNIIGILNIPILPARQGQIGLINAFWRTQAFEAFGGSFVLQKRQFQINYVRIMEIALLSLETRNQLNPNQPFWQIFCNGEEKLANRQENKKA
jgi:hypothetical protein